MTNPSREVMDKLKEWGWDLTPHAVGCVIDAYKQTAPVSNTEVAALINDLNTTFAVGTLPRKAAIAFASAQRDIERGEELLRKHFVRAEVAESERNSWHEIADEMHAMLTKECDRATKTEAERDEYKRNLQAELDGHMEWRKLIGARPNETMFQTADRIAKERAELAAARERINRLRGLCKTYSGILVDLDYSPVEREKLFALIGDTL